MLELAREIGLDPKKTSSNRGGEFHSACPLCGGNDRFMLWPAQGRYWCRQCNASGDAIQFCRDFLHMSFPEARMRVGDSSPKDFDTAPREPFFAPPPSWMVKAEEFVQGGHQRLLADKVLQSQILQERGLTLASIRRYRLGWNPVDSMSPREHWGLGKKMENGHEKKLWLPQGSVIPIYKNDSLCRIKIRKSHWKEGDLYGKYYQVPGSSNAMGIFGDPAHDVAVVVEAEYDAALVAQEAGNLCCCLALGGAQKRPDADVDSWLKGRSLIIFALDFDEAGKKEYSYWRSAYPNCRSWPVPEGKSPADAYKIGINLEQWIVEGLKNHT